MAQMDGVFETRDDAVLVEYMMEYCSKVTLPNSALLGTHKQFNILEHQSRGAEHFHCALSTDLYQRGVLKDEPLRRFKASKRCRE